MSELDQAKVDSILSCVMDKIGYAKDYELECLVISYSELEEILNLFIEKKD